MLDMEMGQQAYKLARDGARASTARPAPALVMVGHWGLSFNVTPPGGQPFDVLVVDHANG